MLFRIALVSPLLLALACGEVTVRPDAGVEAGEPDGGGRVPTCDDCDPNASCDESGETATCECDEGYEGSGFACSDVNECAEDNGGCADTALCINTAGGRECDCARGYVGDGETCEPVWTRLLDIEGLAFNTNNYGAGHAAVYDGRLYFGPRAQEEDMYFRSVELGNLEVREEPLPPGGGEFIASGYGGLLVSEPSVGVCAFGSDGYCFDGDAWAESGYAQTEFHIGEAAAAGVNGCIYEAGGRGQVSGAHRYCPGSGFEAITSLPTGVDDPVGASGGGVFYVLGGRTANDERDRAFAYDTAAGTDGAWTELPRVPSEGRPSGAGVVDGTLFYLTRGNVYLYDIGEQRWQDREYGLPSGRDFRPASAGGRLFLVGDQSDKVVIFELFAE